MRKQRGDKGEEEEAGGEINRIYKGGRKQTAEEDEQEEDEGKRE